MSDIIAIGVWVAVILPTFNTGNYLHGMHTHMACMQAPVVPVLPLQMHGCPWSYINQSVRGLHLLKPPRADRMTVQLPQTLGISWESGLDRPRLLRSKLGLGMRNCQQLPCACSRLPSWERRGSNGAKMMSYPRKIASSKWQNFDHCLTRQEYRRSAVARPRMDKLKRVMAKAGSNGHTSNGNGAPYPLVRL